MHCVKACMLRWNTALACTAAATGQLQNAVAIACSTAALPLVTMCTVAESGSQGTHTGTRHWQNVRGVKIMMQVRLRSSDCQGVEVRGMQCAVIALQQAAGVTLASLGQQSTKTYECPHMRMTTAYGCPDALSAKCISTWWLQYTPEQCEPHLGRPAAALLTTRKP